MELIKLAQVADNLRKTIDSHFTDLAEIDLMISKLERKKRRIMSRADIDCNHLKMMIESRELQDGCSDKFIDECKELIESVKKLFTEGD